MSFKGNYSELNKDEKKDVWKLISCLIVLILWKALFYGVIAVGIIYAVKIIFGI